MINKSDSCCAVVWFLLSSYNYKPNYIGLHSVLLPLLKKGDRRCDIRRLLAWLTVSLAQHVPMQPMMEPANIRMAPMALTITMAIKQLSIVLMSLQLYTVLKRIREIQFVRGSWNVESLVFSCFVLKSSPPRFQRSNKNTRNHSSPLNFLRFYWFKLITWRDRVHPWRDTISP